MSSAPGAFDFGELGGTRVDPNIDFDNLEPVLRAVTGQSDDVTVRWTGQIHSGAARMVGQRFEVAEEPVEAPVTSVDPTRPVEG
ncbi:MAG: hypothetical protein ACRDN9_03145 [Streptosporangiaceae bacterium]